MNWMRRHMLNYILGPDHEVIEIATTTEDGEINDAQLFKWAAWFEDFNNRLVAKTEIGNKRVSTIFLGIDHNYSDDGPPILFETAVFDDEDCDIQARHATWDESVAYHEICVKQLQLEALKASVIR